MLPPCCPKGESKLNRVKFTDRFVKTRKAAPKGQRAEHFDAIIPQLGLRVTDRGNKSYVLLARFPGSPNPTRRALGTVGELKLDEARIRAREWLALLERGIDPKDEAARAIAAEQQKRANTLEAVFEDFVKEKLPSERKGSEVERSLRRDLIARLGHKPITDITRRDILGVIRDKKASAPAQARNLLGDIKRLLTWAVEEQAYGLEASVADGIRARRELGEKPTGDRILSESELFALWRAARRTPYPAGPAYQLLALTGLRLNEVADAVWSEFDFANRIWTIPAERMKGRNGSARSHVVPLTDDILTVLKGLPRGKKGDFVFTTTLGKKPVWMSQKIKERLDARMLRTLEAMARRRGVDPGEVKLGHFTNHDIRRSVRSNLSKLGIREEVAEAVLAHVRPGIKKNYDLHDYLAEKRHALESWGAYLKRLGQEPASNVTSLAAARAGATGLELPA